MTSATLVTLPSAESNIGRQITIKRTSTAGGDTCGVIGIWATDSAGAFDLAVPGASGNAITVYSDGTNWYLISLS